MLNRFATAMLVAGVFAAPAAALDSFSSFNGVNGNGGFSYGYSSYTGTPTLNPFDTSTMATTTGCALNGPTTCLTASGLGVLPQASVGGSYPTVAVPTDSVLVHPGDADSQSVYGLYTAATTGTYTYTIDVRAVGLDATGTGYTPFTSIGGVVTLGTRGTLASYGSAASLSFSQIVLAGQSFGVIVDRNGSYGGDSTALGIAISQVPEPATWGLMIAGFGLVGVGLRRKAALAA